MSWIITDSVTIQCSYIKRIERKRKDQLSNQAPSFDFTRGAPIKSATIKPVFVYIMTTTDDTTIDLSAEDFESIKGQLNAVNQQDLEFTQYIKEHLEFKPGTEAFDNVKKEIYSRPSK